VVLNGLAHGRPQRGVVLQLGAVRVVLSEFCAQSSCLVWSGRVLRRVVGCRCLQSTPPGRPSRVVYTLYYMHMHTSMDTYYTFSTTRACGFCGLPSILRKAFFVGGKVKAWHLLCAPPVPCIRGCFGRRSLPALLARKSFVWRVLRAQRAGVCEGEGERQRGRRVRAALMYIVYAKTIRRAVNGTPVRIGSLDWLSRGEGRNQSTMPPREVSPGLELLRCRLWNKLLTCSVFVLHRSNPLAGPTPESDLPAWLYR